MEHLSRIVSSEEAIIAGIILKYPEFRMRNAETSIEMRSRETDIGHETQVVGSKPAAKDLHRQYPCAVMHQNLVNR